MAINRAMRGVQALLVVGALAFAVAGFTAPQQASRQRACAGTLNPKPPCDCSVNADCEANCYIYCSGHGCIETWAWCGVYTPLNCTYNGNDGLCACWCLC